MHAIGPTTQPTLDHATRPRSLRAPLLLGALALIVFLAHAPYFGLPYFWDELGQFVPAALDLLHDGAWIPHSTVPNSHPPGVMAYLALIWRIFGYSIPATRFAILALAAAAVLLIFLVASEIRPSPAPKIIAAALLLCDPLFFTQSMLAQLDLPAMLFTLLSLLLFLKDRHLAATAACTALVLSKETGAILPLIFIVALYRDPARSKYAAGYLVPFVALGIWFFALWHTTGHIFGNPEFEHYNLIYSLNPVRASVALLRRLYFLFISDFRWIGSLAILAAWKRSRLYATRSWKIVWSFIAAHILLVSLLGGAALERYLLPVLPLVYIAMANGFQLAPPRRRYVGFAALAAGLLAGLFLNPPFPFPYENNLALVDFVDLHRAAAQFLEKSYPNETIYTAWPLTQALRNPASGYVHRSMSSAETSDLHYSTLSALDTKSVNVLVLYSRTWEPNWGVLRWPLLRDFLACFYEYEREMTSAEVRQHFGLAPVERWTRRGQWIEIFARP